MAANDSSDSPKKKRSKKRDREETAMEVELPHDQRADESQPIIADEQHEELLKEQKMYLDIVNKISNAADLKSTEAGDHGKRSGASADKQATERADVKAQGKKRDENRRTHQVSTRLLDEFRRIAKPEVTDGEPASDSTFRFIDDDREAAPFEPVGDDSEQQSHHDEGQVKTQHDRQAGKSSGGAWGYSAAPVTASNAADEKSHDFTFPFGILKVKVKEEKFATDVQFANDFEKDWKSRRALVGRLVKHRHRLAAARARQRQNRNQVPNKKPQVRQAVVAKS